MPLRSSFSAVLNKLVLPNRHLTLALSGGIDSMCLLEVAWQWAKDANVTLAAHHVHHGLSPHADSWLAFCEAQCRRRGIAFGVSHLHLNRQGGESLEAIARNGRYAALKALKTDAIVLAQHQDDQVETFFLQLLRGSGPTGLSGMPLCINREGVFWVRPWLGVPKAQLQAFAEATALQWVEDESNADVQYDRNYWRHDVLPVVAARYPGYRQTIGRAQQWLGEAVVLANELAIQDWDTANASPGLRIDVLRTLSPARARNLLRFFFQLHGLPMLSMARMSAMLLQMTTARPSAEPIMALPDGFGTLRVYRDVAYLVGEWHAADTQTYAWQGAGRYEIPDFLGHLEITQLATGGETALAPAVDFASGFTVKARQGGERLSPGPGRPRQSIKKLWQQTGTPPWMRDRLPFVWVQDVVIWAAGCEVCVPGWEIRWLPYPVHAAASGDSV